MFISGQTEEQEKPKLRVELDETKDLVSEWPITIHLHNWRVHLTLQEAEELAARLNAELGAHDQKRIERL